MPLIWHLFQEMLAPLIFQANVIVHQRWQYLLIDCSSIEKCLNFFNVNLFRFNEIIRLLLLHLNVNDFSVKFPLTTQNSSPCILWPWIQIIPLILKLTSQWISIHSGKKVYISDDFYLNLDNRHG